MATSQSPVAYKQVADFLRQPILGGQYAPGERLATERELCEQFSALRITIRRALQILADEILIQRRHGSGTFAPLLKEIETMYLASGAACGLFVSYYRNDLFRLVSTIRLQVPSEEVLQ